MQTNKKVLITFIFALFLMCFCFSKTKAQQTSALPIPTISGVDIGTESTIFKGNVNGLGIGKYKMSVFLDPDIPQSSIKVYDATFDMKEKVDSKPPYNATFQFSIPAVFDPVSYPKRYATLEKIDDVSTAKTKTCYAYYSFKFFCPEQDTSYKINTTQRQGLDIVFVIDKSETVATVVNNMKTAMLGILDKLDSSIDRVGVVSFGDFATRLVRLSDSASVEKAKSVISSWKAGASTTNLASGIDMATGMFASSASKNKKIIIVVSDGIVNNSTVKECPDKESYPVTANVCTNDTLAKAKTAQQSGITIYSVGYNFAETNKIKANAGNFAKSLMVNIASGSSNFFESSKLSGLTTVFNNILVRNSLVTPKTMGGCSGVGVKFNYNPLTAVNYKFYSGYSSAYRGFDANGINWLYGNINTSGERSNFYISADIPVDQDFTTVLKNQGLGSFTANYQTAKGESKTINFSHDDIINHMFNMPNSLDNYLGQTYFAATYLNTGCGKAPQVDVTVPDESKITPTQGEYTVKRTAVATDCQTAKINLEISCNSELGCKSFNFVDYLPTGVTYQKTVGEIITNCFPPSVGGNLLACTIGATTKATTINQTYFVKFDSSHIGLQATNDTTKNAYIDYNQKPVYFDKGEIDVKKCQEFIASKNFSFTCNELANQSVPNDIVLVLDYSGSMSETEFFPNDMQNLRDGVSNFLDIAGSQDRVAMVQFGPAKKLIDFNYINGNKSKFLNLIPSEGIGSTDMYDGVKIGLDLLRQADKDRPQSKKIMILFTDGGPNVGQKGEDLSQNGVSDLTQAFIQIHALVSGSNGYFNAIDNNKILSTIYLDKEKLVIDYCQYALGYYREKYKCFSSNPEDCPKEIQDASLCIKANKETEGIIKANMYGLKKGNDSIYLEYLNGAGLKDAFQKAFNKLKETSCNDLLFNINLPNNLLIDETATEKYSSKVGSKYVWALGDLAKGESKNINIIFKSNYQINSIIQQAVYSNSFTASYKDYKGSPRSIPLSIK